MKGIAGKVYNVNEGHKPIAGCTVSTALWEDHKHTLTLFSLGAGTDISQELYGYHRIQLVVDGSVNATGDQNQELHSGDAIVTPIGTPVGVHAEREAIYLELALDLESTVNGAIPEGKAFRLADLVPYREGHIVNMDVANDAAFKLALLSFDAGTGLSPTARRAMRSCLPSTERRSSTTKVSNIPSALGRPSSSTLADAMPYGPTSLSRWPCS